MRGDTKGGCTSLLLMPLPARHSSLEICPSPLLSKTSNAPSIVDMADSRDVTLLAPSRR
eukprot:SAG25_NODE_166_length_13075_cov_19.523736_14_plen_59_part_00